MASVTDLRYEMKLVCDPRQVAQARSWIRLHPAAFVSAYPRRLVNTLYLDTPHFTFFNDNLAGVSRRDKVRMRWYGGHTSGIQPCLEIKQKASLLGRKKRLPLACRLDLERPWREILDIVRDSADETFSLALQTATQPAIITRYNREYFVTPDGDVRCTLDYDQRAYDQRLSVKPDLHRQLPIEPLVIIEVKAPEAQDERLWEIVARFPVRRSRNSKYAIGVTTAFGSE
jgi:hypothetical protein